MSNNDVSVFWEKLLSSHKNDYGSRCEQISSIEINLFKTLKDYQNKYKNVELIDKTSDDHPYFEAKRKLKLEELISQIKPNTFLKTLYLSGIKPYNDCYSYLYKNGPSCAGGETSETGYSEYIEIPTISFVFLGITNASKDQIKLNYLNELILNSNSNYSKIKLPNFNLLPYEMVLIPVSTNLNIQIINDEGMLLDFIDGDRSQDYRKISNLLNPEKKDNIIVGKSLEIKSIVYNDNNGEYEVPVHELDFNNLYSISREWHCGCCPHLFFILENGKQQYSREILKKASTTVEVEIFVIPKGVVKVLIKELENEVTNITDIKINDGIIVKDIILSKGESYDFDVQSDDVIEITGKYTPQYNTKDQTNDVWFRNKLIEISNKCNYFIRS